MVTCTESFDFDSFRQIYDIREVKSLADFLLPGHSLCIIHSPEWREFRKREFVDAAKLGGIGGRVRLVKVRGHQHQGEPDELLLGICGPEDQGYYRQKLDINLKSPFLFATWKRESHEFKLIRERQTVACFSTLDEALAAYLANGFIPECSMEEKELNDEHICDPDGLHFEDGGIE